MRAEILSVIRPFLFQDTVSKVSVMLDQYRSEIESGMATKKDKPGDIRLLEDQVDHLLKAMTMILKVSTNSDGAMMARGIAEEAISTTAANDRP
jgi:hypothetical protein